MTRPLRLEFPGALYHVTARGNRSNAIFRDDTDRLVWLEIIAQTCQRHHCSVHSYCQMGNHYHLMIETAFANLSQAMRHLNGLYSEYFNRRHHIVGHMFQGRYKAILVQRESYLLELSRYIVLNPVRAKIVRSFEQWPWSSFQYFVA
jgi:REP element-mobilizing transposase RayT